MLKIYIFSLVVGLGLALLSMMSDFFDVEGAELDVDVDVDVDGGLPDPSFTKLLATYGLLYFALGFGAAGTAISLILGVESSFHLPGAIITGVMSSVAATRLIHYLRRSNSGDRMGDDSWSGAIGSIVLPLGDGSIGEVKVIRADRQHTLRALPHPSWTSTSENPTPPDDWGEIMVIEVEKGIAYVVPTEDT